jgi:SAM-dependent methyltransferase
LTAFGPPTDNPGVVDDVATFDAPADAYDAHVGRYGPALAAALVEVADIATGGRALDVGCGPGALTAALAGRVGAGRVAAVDPSEPFVAACRARVPRADVRTATAEALPFADGSFDAVLSQLVVNFLADAPRAVAEMARVTAAGGTVAACVWDYADGMTLLRAFWDAAVALDPERAGPLDERARMPFCSPESLRALWEAAGLRDVETGPLSVRASYRSLADLWWPLERGVAPSGAYAASLPAEDRAALRAELRRRLGAGDAPFDLTARAWYVKGRTAGAPR